MSNARREFLLELENVKGSVGLEIGPLNKPLVKKEELENNGEIFYLDHLSTEELQEKYKDEASVKTDEIVSVDFVCRDGDIIKATSGHTFDYVVASHMIEHAPNLLLFLSEVHNILKPGGTCVLIIPDKRFTFDINRPVSTFGSVLESFLSKATYPSISAVYDHSAMAINANGHNLWYGIVNADDSRLLASENIGWEAAHRVHKEGHYYDVHVNIFTPESFCSILEKAISHEIVFFEVSKFVDTQVGQIEFMLQLKKPQNGSNELVKSRCLASIPKFEIESILSPYMPQVKSLSNALEKVSETSVNQQKQLMELREQIGSQNKKIDELKDRLNLTQLVLDRRSVKLAVGLVDKFFSIIRKKSF